MYISFISGEICVLIKRDCAQFFFIGLKVAPFPTDQGVIGEKSDKSLKKIEKNWILVLSFKPNLNKNDQRRLAKVSRDTM